jgi:hypothetical protein
MLFLGVDWGERHHDLCLLDQDGSVLAARRIGDGLAGMEELHGLVAAYAEQPAQVAVGIETDRGLLVGALVAAGYQVYAVNPQVVSRYRDRHGSSRAKSDRGDAKVLADLVRTDRHNHRQVAGDSPLAEAVKVLARAHQNLPGAAGLAGRLTTGSRGCRGVAPPGDAGHLVARGRRCSCGRVAVRSSAMGRSGSSAGWVKRRRRRHRPAGEVGRLPRSRLTGATAPGRRILHPA